MVTDVSAHGWVLKYAFVFAIAAALLSVVICYFRKGHAGLSFQAPFLDALRAAAAFPLFLFFLSPLYPEYGTAVLNEEPLVVALGALGGLTALMSDWWRNI
jgi:hypothetical protein